MKKFIKLLISSMLILSILFSLEGTAHAATLKSKQSNLISIEKYEDTMSQIYANYGIEWKIIDASDSVPITRALFNSEIKRAYRECEEYQAQLNKSKSEYSDSIQVPDTDIGINLMPIKKSVSASTTVQSWPWYKCKLTARAMITYNGSTGYTMWVDWWNISYEGVNLDKWVDEGSYISQSSTHFTAIFRGTCHFSYTVPVTNQKISLSVPVYAGSTLR